MNTRTCPVIVVTIRSLRQQGMSYAQIAQNLGRSQASIEHLATKYNLRYSIAHLISFWSLGRVARAQQLANDGLSASQIGADLGCTRNAVIGKLRRVHVALNGKAGARHGNQRKTRPRPPNGRSEPVSMPIPEPIEAIATELEHEPPSRNWVRFADLAPFSSRRHCRWPVAGDPGPDMLCCGAERVDAGQPYCEFHHARGHTASGVRR